MGVVEVGEWTVSSRTEVKCYQFIWSFRERCWFESTMRESHRVPKKRSEHKHLLTVTKTGHGSLGRPRKPCSAPERIVFQTPDDRVELLFRSSGVWGTESFTAASTDWSDVSLNRDELEWVCLRSKLWMQPVTEWVFSTHTRTQTHTLTHPFSSHSRTFRHMYKHTTSHLWHKKPAWNSARLKRTALCYPAALALVGQTDRRRVDVLTSGEETRSLFCFNHFKIFWSYQLITNQKGEVGPVGEFVSYLWSGDGADICRKCNHIFTKLRVVR